MLRVHRALLPKNVQAELNQAHNTRNQAQSASESWAEFGKTQTYQDIKSLLQTIFHKKCAYCEVAGAQKVEHHWPKSPHPHNANRGTSGRMYLWNNLLLACEGCNGFECKGSHMKWDANNDPILLNPTVVTDDPLCYFEFVLDGHPSFTVGWVEPKLGISPLALERAQYTIGRLKLNRRDHLVRGRAKNIRRFFELMCYLKELGPDFQAPPNHKVRDKFAELLSAEESYLAPIRQILYGEPAYAYLRQEILDAMPELQPILDSWALPKSDCSHTL